MTDEGGGDAPAIPRIPSVSDFPAELQEPLRRHAERLGAITTSRVVVIEDPDGVLHGNGDVIASADAAAWRLKDLPPRTRAMIDPMKDRGPMNALIRNNLRQP